MKAGNPVQTLSQALNAALLRDLPDYAAQVYIAKTGDERLVEARRPDEREVEVYMFPELWGSTALGYGGMGGASMTTADTVVIASSELDTACVYWGGGQLGMKVDYEASMKIVKNKKSK